MKLIKKFTIDANVFVSGLTENELNHLYSKRFLEFLFDNKIVFAIPMLVFFEVFHSLRKNGCFKMKGDYIKFRRIFSSKLCKYIHTDGKLFKFFREFNFFANLKTSDAIIATVALTTKSILISWDKNLLAKAHNAYTPKEFLEKFSK